MTDQRIRQRISRRGVFRLGGGIALAAALGSGAQAQSAPSRAPSSARVVIIGAGAGGIALANRLVRRMDAAQITLIDPRAEHYYQPGLSLVAAGLKSPSYAISRTADWLPRGVSLISEPAVAIDPVARTVMAGGQSIQYDFLVVAPGLVLDHDAIAGFSLDLVGTNGIGALYAGPEYAARTWTAAHAFAETGGSACSPGGKTISTTELPDDYIHVIPPQRAPEVIRQSGLSWGDRWTDHGWVECDMKTLRHLRYPEVFALGDVAGVPKGKTAASVKWQVPVVEDHLIAAMNGVEGTAIYDNYTSYPLITRVGRAMLVEFDYNNNLTPSFPGIIAPLEELWISWLMKEIALKPTYQAMLRGQA